MASFQNFLPERVFFLLLRCRCLAWEGMRLLLWSFLPSPGGVKISAPLICAYSLFVRRQRIGALEVLYTYIHTYIHTYNIVVVIIVPLKQ